MVKIVFLVLLSCLTAALARDETASCRDVTRQTCNGFQQCCARRCGGPHQTSCTESGSRISTASCNCEGRTGSTHTGTTQTTDHSNICRLTAEGSCTTFKTCCENRCARPERLSCSVGSGRTLTTAVCQCPVSAMGGSGHFSHTTPRSGSGHFSHTTPRSGSGHFSHSTPRGGSTHGGQGGLQETGEQDFTHTCTRNYNDCTAFRNCCTNRCPGRSVQSQCQERGGRLTNTICKCGRN